MNKIKPIAFYLPQFHRLKINDDYWGKGFTEWTNTAKAKPLFPGHYQPHVPADLGFYDLTMSSIREEQAALAKEYGIYGFCYWHYWFDTNCRVMETPFDEVVKTGKPDFPFCLAWANHDWYNPQTKEIIIKQKYSGSDDYIAHFNCLKTAFLDHRYITIDERPLFIIFNPIGFDDFTLFKSIWNKMAKEVGLKEFYFVGIATSSDIVSDVFNRGYDGVNVVRIREFYAKQNYISRKIISLGHTLFKFPYRCLYKTAMKYFINAEQDIKENIMPTIISGWDHTPRSGRTAIVLDKFTPELFSQHVREAFDLIKQKENQVIFIRAWNEWAEGNHLEPDLKYGLGYLEAIKNNLSE